MTSLSVTGHRHKKLGGSNMKNPIMLKLKEALLREFEYYIVEKNVTDFYTGGALGADQAAFWCVEILKKKYPHIKNILAIPYAKFGTPTYSEVHKKVISWTKIEMEWFQKMKLRADKIVYVDEVAEYQKDKKTPIGEFSYAKLQIRNEYLVDNAKYLVSVWDGIAKGGTWNCLNYAFKQTHLAEIIQLQPNDFIRFEIEKREGA